MVLVIDNYDSFAYNLAQYLGELGQDPQVYRNDKLTVLQIEKLKPAHIIISPGPGTPANTGVTNDAIAFFAGRIPILGVCLGHQCIGYVFGARIVKSPMPTHGKSTPVLHDGATVYRGLDNPFEGGRYHSLVVEAISVPSQLTISAWNHHGLVMGLRHTRYVVEGVQFHPESILTPAGHNLLANFLSYRDPVWVN